MANSLITLSLLANAGLAHAITCRWPFNACEVCEDFDSLSIFMRFCDRNAPRKYSHRQQYAFAYDESGYSDGSEKEIHFDDSIRSWSLDGIRDLIDKAMPDPWSISGVARNAISR